MILLQYILRSFHDFGFYARAPTPGRRSHQSESERRKCDGPSHIRCFLCARIPGQAGTLRSFWGILVMLGMAGHLRYHPSMALNMYTVHAQVIWRSIPSYIGFSYYRVSNREDPAPLRKNYPIPFGLIQ
jgi:hypothetical protein